MALPSKLLLFPLILCSVAPLVAQDVLPPTTLAKQDAAAYLKPLNKRGVVRYKTIASDFNTNQVAAIGKYAGKRITVIGRVAHLSQGESENKALVVTLQDASASLPAVKGIFLAGSIPQNSEIQISSDGSTATMVNRDGSGNILSQNTYLSVDQTVAIKGDYKELKVGDIVLTDCKLIPKERLHELRNDLDKAKN
jgi:hypothetical protein